LICNIPLRLKFRERTTTQVGWLRWNPSWDFTKTEVLDKSKGNFCWKGARYQKFTIQGRDPKVYSMMGKGCLEYGESLHTAPSQRNFPWKCNKKELEGFMSEHFFDRTLIRGAKLINDYGIFTEMYHLQASSVKKKYLDQEAEHLREEQKQLTNKWVDLDRKRRNVEAKVCSAKKFLLEAQVLEQIREAYDKKDTREYLILGKGGDWLMTLKMGQKYHLPHELEILENCQYHGVEAAHKTTKCLDPHHLCKPRQLC
jgi:hypothetical protein